MDYFGNYKSPEWEVMHQMEEDNECITGELPQLEDEIKELEHKLMLEQRKTRLVQTYKAADPESTVSRKIKSHKSVTSLILL